MINATYWSETTPMVLIVFLGLWGRSIRHNFLHFSTLTNQPLTELRADPGYTPNLLLRTELGFLTIGSVVYTWSCWVHAWKKNTYYNIKLHSLKNKPFAETTFSCLLQIQSANPLSIVCMVLHSKWPPSCSDTASDVIFRILADDSLTCGIIMWAKAHLHMMS